MMSVLDAASDTALDAAWRLQFWRLRLTRLARRTLQLRAPCITRMLTVGTQQAAMEAVMEAQLVAGQLAVLNTVPPQSGNAAPANPGNMKAQCLLCVCRLCLQGSRQRAPGPAAA
jgi:hypothetical protein